MFSKIARKILVAAVAAALFVSLAWVAVIAFAFVLAASFLDFGVETLARWRQEHDRLSEE